MPEEDSGAIANGETIRANGHGVSDLSFPLVHN